MRYIGPGASGNYVKMVHNGIEYGDMQLIGEACHYCRAVGGMSPSELAAFIEACSKSGLPAFELVNFVAYREALLKQLGTIHPSVSALDESKQRDFAKRARAKPRLPPPPTSLPHLLLPIPPPPIPCTSCLLPPTPTPTSHLPPPPFTSQLLLPTDLLAPASCLLLPIPPTVPTPVTRARL